MTKNTEVEGIGARGGQASRGFRSTRLAGQRGVRFTDQSGNDVIAPEWLLIGATVEGDDDDPAIIRIGGGGSGGSGEPGDPGATAGVPIPMLNNAGEDLNLGDAVVVDETADRAVTTTTTDRDIHIAGIVQEPIPDGDTGLVLFNGYAPYVNAPDAVRGEYAKTSTTAKQAASTPDREAGSFAVYLTGTDLPDFASDAVTTEQAIPVSALEIGMPATIPADRALFLALWLTSDGTDPEIDGWTRIGAEAGFYYFYRISTGDDTAEATWTGSSVAVASVLLLHPSVSLAVPLEDHDYDTSTSAATVTGLSDAARYAIAGVQADVAVPGSGFEVLAGGVAGFVAGGTLTIVQEKEGNTSAGSGGLTFDAAVTPGNLVVSVMTDHDGGAGGTGTLMMADFSGVPDTSWTDIEMNRNTDSPGNCDYVSIQARIAPTAFAGPYYTNKSPTATPNRMYLFEVSGVGIAGFESTGVTGSTDDPVVVGSFASVGANDLVILAGVAKDTTGGTADPVVTIPSGFTQDYDANMHPGRPWIWIGHAPGSGGALSLDIDHTTAYNWGVAAAHFVGGSQGVAGTLAGKYIGHDSSATSPFTGGAEQDDAIFAINLLADAKPSALLYGPDLGAAASGSSLIDAGGYYTATDVEGALQELAAKDIGYQAHGNMGASETFSALTGWHSGTFDASSTFTFSGATSGLVASMVLELTENGTGGYSPTWPGSVVWPGGVMPTHDTTAGTTTIYLFESRDGGTTWYGFQAGGGGSSSVTELDDLTDVTITAVAEDDHLQYVGGQWVNNQRYRAIVTDGFDTLVWEGDDLTWEWSS